MQTRISGADALFIARPCPACLTGLRSLPDGTQPPLASRALRIMRAGPLNIPAAGAAGAFLGGACRGMGTKLEG